MNEEITIGFDVANKRDMTVFDGIKKLPKYISIHSTAGAFLKFMDALIISVIEREERNMKK